MSKKVLEKMNEQVNKEFSSWYAYLQMAAFCEDLGYDGFGKWFRLQAGEEYLHAMKFFDHILERGGQVKLTPIPAPHTGYKTIPQVVKVMFEHEKKVSESIFKIVHLAKQQADYASESFLDWFVTEQVEEEATAGKIHDRVCLAEDDAAALLIIDHELSLRSPTKDED